MDFGRLLLFAIACFTPAAIAKDSCSVQGISRIKSVSSMDSTKVDRFLESYRFDCSANSEFTELRNEILFKILEGNSAKIFRSPLLSDSVVLEHVLTDIENPIHDLIDTKKIYCQVVIKVPENSSNGRKILESLNIATKKIEPKFNGICGNQAK